ncbi:MAG: SDR family oxidoreductase [Desulfobacteraceae bacterium]|nr:SDR family oxidoreductase [Desulfobacteraceae bacterium]MBC2756238.1 SDR family oxidoreductase [Desulfobacteraceae bacterium]
MKLKDKVALVTGAGSGIGKAIATLFAKEGAKVVVADIDPEKGQETADMIKQSGWDARYVQSDVSREADCEKMIQFTQAKFGKLDILCNNAGIAMVICPVENVSEELWDHIMAVNLKSVFLTCKIAIPIMKEQGGGIVINVSSVSGIRPRSGLCAYSASKSAVTTLTKALAIEAATHNIRINSISPVATDTPMLEDMMTDEMKENVEVTKQFVLATIPIGKFAQPEDIAKAALFLASEDASMVTGIDLPVDGGRSI